MTVGSELLQPTNVIQPTSINNAQIFEFNIYLSLANEVTRYIWTIRRSGAAYRGNEANKKMGVCTDAESCVLPRNQASTSYSVSPPMTSGRLLRS